MSEVLNKNVGHATAYAYAKSKGYTGTEEEFAELMASYADVAQQAIDAKNDAVQAKDDAVAAKDTAVEAKDTAVQSKDTAVQAESDAENAKDDAEAAQGLAEDARDDAQAEALKSEGHAVGTQNGTAVPTTSPYYHNNAKWYSEQAETSASTASNKAGEASRSASDADQAKTDAVAAKDRAEEILESIPADYSQLSNDVTDLKTALAHAYDATKLYHAGEIIYHNGVLYVCLENFEEAEPFTAAHWSQIYVGDELRQIHTAVHALEMLEKSRSFTPAQLEEICKDGVASDYFEIGDIIYIPWTDYAQTTPITYSVPHVVVHFGNIEDQNGDIHENGMWLMWMYATPNAVQFDHPEAIIATEETFQSGYYYYTKNGNDYVAQPDVVVGDPIPTGETYYHHVRPYMTGRLRYGSNDWTQSAYRQYLNSAAGKGEWWTAQHESDVAPDQANTLPGFMSGYAQDWLDIFKPIKVTTALNTACDGGVDAVTYDTFFLPSLEQMYGAPQKSGVEGDVWEYWIQETGYPSRTNGSSSNTNDARKIPSITAPDGAAVACRLRSAYRSNTLNVWTVHTAGYLYNYSAYSAYRAQPACVIY